MRKILTLLLLALYGQQLLSQATCATTSQICTAAGVTYTNSTNVSNLGRMNCLGSTPNASWFYFTPSTPGALNIQISQVSNGGGGIDVDYAIWGPYNTPTAGCSDIMDGSPPSPLACSYSTAAVENASINVQSGKFYIMIVTNYANQAGTISVTQTNGSASGAATLSCIPPCIDPDNTVMQGATSVGSTYLDMVEGCLNGWMTYDLSSAYDHDTLINYSLSGTATNGTDYLIYYQTSSGSTVMNTVSGTIPVSNGQTHGVFNIQPLTDATIEGTETVTLSLTGACGHILGSYTLNIVDSLPHGATATPPSACAGTTIQLNAIAHQDATFSWSPPASVSNSNIQNPTATPAVTTKYYVNTYEGGCNYRDSVTVTISPSNTVPSGIDTGLCPGQPSVTLTVPSFVPSGSTYTWSNGLGNASTATATTPGSYSLTATTGGCQYVVTAFIVRQYTTTPPALRDTSVCFGSPYILSSPDSTLRGYSWGPNGENTSSVSVTAAGTYSFTAIDTNGCSVTSTTATISQSTSPFTVSIGRSQDSICPSGAPPVTFTASASVPGVSFLWLPDSLTTTSINVTDPMFVTLEGMLNGCTYTDTFNLLRYSPKTILLRADTTICRTDSVALTPSGAPYLSYQWSTGETAMTVYANAAGSYVVTVFDGCYWESDTFALDTFATTTIPPLRDTTVCSGNAVTIASTSPSLTNYMWQPNGQSTSSISVSAAGNYYFTADDVNGCKVYSDTATVTALNPTLTFTQQPNPLCQSQGNATIDAGYQPGVTYTWSTGVTADSIIVSSGGTVGVTASISGCQVTGTYNVVTVSAPTLSLGAAKNSCCEDIVLNPTPNVGWTYVWSSGDTTASVTVNGGSTFSQVYTVTATDLNGCTVAVSDTANIWCINATGGASPDTIYAGGSSLLGVVTQYDNGNFVYTWTPPSGLTPNGSTATASPNSSETYSVIVTDSVLGCVDSTSIYLVVIYPGGIAMPSAFTPNGDGHNDYYYPVFFSPQVKVVDFRIYNRWGQLIYDNPNAPGWSGVFKGEGQPTEVYTYYVNVTTPDSTNPSQQVTIKKQGSFTLLR